MNKYLFFQRTFKTHVSTLRNQSQIFLKLWQAVAIRAALPKIEIITFPRLSIIIHVRSCSTDQILCKYRNYRKCNGDRSNLPKLLIAELRELIELRETSSVCIRRCSVSNARLQLAEIEHL